MTWSSDLPDVSRETLDKLEAFTQILKKWNCRINLVAASEVDFLWSRHIEDSAQLAAHIDAENRSLLDLGSGGGFPGLVLAIIAQDLFPELSVSLVDSDTRKCAFLLEAARILDLQATIHRERVEHLNIKPADIITARAFAPLEKIFRLASRFTHEETVLLLHKGAKAQDELTESAEAWHSQVQRFPSLTETDGVILKVTGLRKRS